MSAKISRRDAGKLLATLPALACASALINGPVWAEARIDAADPHPGGHVKVLDTEIEYVDTGRGDPIVFLHGNPTCSYQWRNVVPYVSKVGRCVAPDLVGMGRSGTSPKHSYRFIDQARYLDAWFDALGLTKNVVLVVHDWGAAIGFYRASRFPRATFKALRISRRLSRSDIGRRWVPTRRSRALRSERGERLVLDENFFVEVVLPSGIIRKLSKEEMDAYRAPYQDREKRLPTLVWPREIPIDGEPADVLAIVQDYAKVMAASPMPSS